MSNMIVELSDSDIETLKMAVGCAVVECLIPTRTELALIKKLESAVPAAKYRRNKR